MSDENANEQVVEETPQVEGEQTEAVLTSEKPTEEEGLPEGVSERTRQEFEKLKQHNKEMSQKLEKLEKVKQLPSVLDAYLPEQGQATTQQPDQQFSAPSANQFSHLSQQQVDSAVNNFVDENGYVDVNALNSHLAQANARARQAEDRARQAEQRAARVEEKVTRYEVDQQAKDLHKAYPEVDPYSDSFDRDAYDLVKKELLNQLIETGKQDPLAAAKSVEKYFRKDPQQEVKKQQVEAREQATVSVGSGSRQPTVTKVNKAPIRSKEALKARLEAAGY